MYQERRSRLPGGFVWRRVNTGETVRVLPDATMDVIWSEDEGLFVAGPDTTAQLYRGQPGRALVGIRMPIGLGPMVLGVPAHELRDRRVPLEAIWRSADVGRLDAQVATSRERGRALEFAIQKRLAECEAPAGTRTGIVTLLRRGATVTDAARRLGVSERQLHRLSLDAFGYGPKMLARILRFGRAVHLARAGTPLVEVAAVTGYADQAHLSRDVKALAGIPLTELRR
jgi:AraC-like DNA-binding protein